MRIALTVLPVALLAGSVPAFADSLTTPPAVGPIGLGMSVEEALEANPGISWEKTSSPVTGNTLEISATSAWALDGYSYTVKFRPRAHRWATLELSGREEGTSLRTCRRQVLSLAARLEPHFPRMDASFAAMLPRPPTPGTIVAQRSPEGYVTVTGQPGHSDGPRSEFLSVGTSARVLETVVNDDRTTWEFQQAASQDYPYAVRVAASFDELSYPASAGWSDRRVPACIIEATLEARPKGRPDFETLDTTRIKPVELPTRALLHETIEGTSLPAAGVTLGFQCEVSRMKGRLEGCRLGDRAMLAAFPDPLRLELAAMMRLDAWRFNPKALDPDSDVPLRAEVKVHLSPKDRDPRLAAASGPIPIWTRTASAQDLSREYPPAALAQGIGALVTATCRIREDLSLECLSYETDPPGLVQFHAPTGRILARYRAAPRLKNDQPAAGTTTRVRVQFIAE